MESFGIGRNLSKVSNMYQIYDVAHIPNSLSRRVLPAPVTAREETAPNGSSREQAKTARQSREHGGSSSSNTFLTDLDPDLNDEVRHSLTHIHLKASALCDNRLRLTFMNLFVGAVDTLSFSTYFRR